MLGGDSSEELCKVKAVFERNTIDAISGSRSAIRRAQRKFGKVSISLVPVKKIRVKKKEKEGEGR